MKDFFDQVPKTIAESAKSPLGIVALIVLALSFLGYAFFAKASEAIRVAMFILMFAGYGLLGATLVRASGARRRAVTPRKAPDNRQPQTMALPSASVSAPFDGPVASVATVPAHVELERVMRRLAIVWFGGAFLVTALLAAQTLLGKYAEPQVPFAWFAPLAFPVSSVLIAAFMSDRISSRVVPGLLAYVSVGASTLAVTILIVAILLEPFSTTPPQQWFSAFTMYLAPIVGLAIAAITYMLLAAAPSEKPSTTS